jgi:hypothetical protein
VTEKEREREREKEREQERKRARERHTFQYSEVQGLDEEGWTRPAVAQHSVHPLFSPP